MARISTVEAKARISEMINRVAYGGERLVIQRRGKDLVALVPMEDYLMLSGEAVPDSQPQPSVQEEANSLIDPPIQQINVQVEWEEEEDDNKLEVNLL